MEALHTLWENRGMSEPQSNLESREAISARLRLTRRALDFNQADWCRFVGIAPNTWNQYEKATSPNRISLEEALKVARKTGVGLDWIYRGEEAMLPKRVADALDRLRDEDAAPRKSA